MKPTKRVGRRTIKVSNLDKVFWPDSGFTKGDLIDYYEAVAGVMVPHVRNRLMTLERFPDGIEKERFFSKSIPRYFPDWIARKNVPKSGGTVTHVVCNESATLVYLANQAVITPHVGLSRVKETRVPDQLIIDLDPPEDGFKIVRRAAFTLKEILESVGLVPYTKLTGSKGVHVMAPITPKLEFGEVHEIALRLAKVLVARHPKDLTLEVKKAERVGRTLVDFMRNSYAQTVVAPFGVRARPGAPVAVPLEWDELKDGKLGPRAFSILEVPKRVEESGDPWKGWGANARSLPAAARKIDALIEAG
jgi:bifunctional non-homologous end joining protein LigD